MRLSSINDQVVFFTDVGQKEITCTVTSVSASNWIAECME